MEIKIVLSREEFLYAANIAVTRQVDNILAGRREKYQSRPKEAYWKHILGTCGELAVAKYFGAVYTGNLGDLRAHDVNVPGKKIEVRTTDLTTGGLIIHTDEEESRHDSPFLLVTGAPPRLSIRGWYICRDAMKEEFLRVLDPGRPPQYVVPQSLLFDPGLLKIISL